MKTLTWVAGALAVGAVVASGAASASDIDPSTFDDSRASLAAAAATGTASEGWAVHGQFTLVAQHHRPFKSPYSGANSLLASEDTKETIDLTLFAGVRLWSGAQLWLNPEIDQGFGLSNTVGAAGFPSGEAYKIGAHAPYLRVPRVFVRQVIGLGSDSPQVVDEPGPNILGGSYPAENLTLTVGKLGVVDLFDTNRYAHDPRADFMNWSVIESGAFDYASDPWGYTFGAAGEWNTGDWTWRGGVFQLSDTPNAKIETIDFRRFMLVAEAERRVRWAAHDGKIKLLLFANRARMARYDDAVRLAQATGTVADVANVRSEAWRTGIALNIEQEIASSLGAFVRLSANDGRRETYEFTEINRSLALGLALKGDPWGRHDDTLGLAGVTNRLSGAARSYLAAGGLGVLIGDGRLDYASERIIESYYAATLARGLSVALDWQSIRNPAYNRDRGPVTVWGLRVHAEF